MSFQCFDLDSFCSVLFQALEYSSGANRYPFILFWVVSSQCQCRQMTRMFNPNKRHEYTDTRRAMRLHTFCWSYSMNFLNLWQKSNCTFHLRPHQCLRRSVYDFLNKTWCAGLQHALTVSSIFIRAETFVTVHAVRLRAQLHSNICKNTLYTRSISCEVHRTCAILYRIEFTLVCVCVLVSDKCDDDAWCQWW